MSASRLRRVAVLVLDGAKPLDVGIPAQVFTTRASMPYEVRVCGAAPGLVTGGDGLSYSVSHGLDALAWADIVFVPGYRFPDRDDPPRAVIDALIAAHDRGARLAAISTGAFALAATGLLDGKRATTHWHYARALVARHPLVRLDENVLFVDEGSVLTSAGAASGIDLCLHILRRDLGVAASNHAARRLVAAPYRSGGQAQYVPRSVPEPLGERFAATIDLNITATVHLAKRLLPAMVARGTGRVLITSSIASTMPGPYQAVYNASKSFLQSFSQALSDELKDTGVTVTSLMPGATATDFFRRAHMLDTRVGRAKKDNPALVAEQGFQAMTEGRQKIVAGSVKTKLQGAVANRVLPDRVKALMHHRMAEPGGGR